ncbi:unnamed protein product [Caenorhabditis angaria]|uniref:Uncharacterized protein n=1 Tax=Caenorhabditis angaria TaxID=860376 RepID=A0A9P1IZ67_9PELO|nr:unnamed protein product [Caenorhabditis angaria]
MLLKFLLVVFILYLTFEEYDALDSKDYEKIKEQWKNENVFKGRRDGIAQLARGGKLTELEIQQMIKRIEENDQQKLDAMKNEKEERFKNKKILQIIWKLAQRAEMADAYLLDVYEELGKIYEDPFLSRIDNSKLRKIRRYIRKRAKFPPQLSNQELAELEEKADEMEKLAEEEDAETISDADRRRLKQLFEEYARIFDGNDDRVYMRTAEL